MSAADTLRAIADKIEKRIADDDHADLLRAIADDLDEIPALVGRIDAILEHYGRAVDHARET